MFMCKINLSQLGQCINSRSYYVLTVSIRLVNNIIHVLLRRTCDASDNAIF